MKKLRKIYYFPGMMSLLVIPLVFWYLGNRKLKEPIPVVMDFSVQTKYNPKIPLNEQFLSFEPLRNLKFKKIVVQPNTAKQNSKYYVSELKNLQKRNEKGTGIEFVLTNENSYGDFASLLNDMAISKQYTWSLDLDKTGHFFAVTDYIDPKKVDEPCYLCNDTVAIVIDNNGSIIDMNSYDKFIFAIQKFYGNFQNYLPQLPKNTFYIIFGYLFLVQISVLGLVRKSI